MNCYGHRFDFWVIQSRHWYCLSNQWFPKQGAGPLQGLGAKYSHFCDNNHKIVFNISQLIVINRNESILLNRKKKTSSLNIRQKKKNVKKICKTTAENYTVQS